MAGKKNSYTPTPKRRRMRRMMRIFIGVAIALAVAVLITMIIIYSFSAESKEESGSRGTGIVTLLVKIFYPDYDSYEYLEKQKIVRGLNHIVRKFAHFAEFGLLGFLAAALLLHLRRRYDRIHWWMTWVFPAVFCLIYAISDEVHQIFSNRGPAVKDVLIDFAGAVTGIVLIQIIELIQNAIRKKASRNK